MLCGVSIFIFFWYFKLVININLRYWVKGDTNQQHRPNLRTTRWAATRGGNGANKPSLKKPKSFKTITKWIFLTVLLHVDDPLTWTWPTLIGNIRRVSHFASLPSCTPQQPFDERCALGGCLSTAVKLLMSVLGPFLTSGKGMLVEWVMSQAGRKVVVTFYHRLSRPSVYWALIVMSGQHLWPNLVVF